MYLIKTIYLEQFLSSYTKNTCIIFWCYLLRLENIIYIYVCSKINLKYFSNILLYRIIGLYWIFMLVYNKLYKYFIFNMKTVKKNNREQRFKFGTCICIIFRKNIYPSLSYSKWTSKLTFRTRTHVTNISSIIYKGLSQT